MKKLSTYFIFSALYCLTMQLQASNSELCPDPFTKGEEGTIHIHISEYGGSDGPLFQAWDFDTNTERSINTGFQGTYKTIGIGEYEWTSENLQAIYRERWGTNAKWL
ncbi:hypothetical protein [Dysgonomonas sp. 216]|uniref:hypothetical protein n=1 Tax=Dysgonomonas sp. 216 TaxID=2302934 RepID=UPI0013D0BA1D|nr:hypothetical protein [Dysgonomonas sp. 216]